MFGRLVLQTAVCAFALALAPPGASSQTGAAVSAPDKLAVLKIDPPNWYSSLPQPLLLLRGTGLQGATFRISDRSLRIDRSVISTNGHWAQLFLSTSPAHPETVQLNVTRGAEKLNVPYTFSAPRHEGDGASGFSPRDIMYLIMTDRFADGDLTNDGPEGHSAASSAEAAAERAKPRGWHGGDLRGIQQHLDYLQSFGITAVWATPVYQNHGPEAYHGYHATDYYAVDEHYGSLADLQALAKALHARGMKLVLDTVPNHVGPFHPWLDDPPAPNWFHGSKAQHLEAESNFDALINPHAPMRDRIATLDGWFVNLLPDMNTDDPVVAQYLRQNAVWWIEETAADAIRIDTFPYVNREFWHDFHAELHQIFPHLTEVGEVSNGDPEVTSAFAAGSTRAAVDTGLYTPFDFPLYYASRDVFGKGAPFTRIARVLEQDELYPHPERLVPFLGNHDGSRLAHAVTDPAERKLAFAFLMTTRGLPQIYSGDEIGMQGGDDPDNRRDFPGGFPAGLSTASADAGDAFKAGGRSPDQQDLFKWVQQLATLRQSHPALTCGAEQVLASQADLLAYARFGSSGCTGTGSATPERLLLILQRNGPQAVHIDLRDTALSGCRPGTPLAGEGQATVDGDQLTVTPPTPFMAFACQ